MNRRDFLKLAGLGIASVAVPKAVIESISPRGFLVPFECIEKLDNFLGEHGEYITVTVRGNMRQPHGQ